MIPSGKSTIADQGNVGNMPVGANPQYNLSSTPVNVLDILNTLRGPKSDWFEGPVAAEDWHGFTFYNHNSWEPFFNERKIGFDVAVGAVGSEVVLVEGLIADQPSHVRPGSELFIPLFVPKGETVSFRVAFYANTTSGSFQARPSAAGQHNDIIVQRFYHRSETIGIDTVASPVLDNFYGTLLNPTVANTWTSWVSIGTNTFDWQAFHAQFGMGFNGIDPTHSLSLGPYQSLGQIAIGASKEVIVDNLYFSADDSGTGFTDWTNGYHQFHPTEMYVPAGTEFFARIQTDVLSDIPARSKDLRIIGFG